VSWRRRIAAACAALLAAGAARADGSGPVWVLQGDAGRVYLAGSVHVLPRDAATLPDGFDVAYRDAEQLVMEIDLDDLDPLAAQRYLMEHSLLPEGTTLPQVIGTERHARVADAAARVGLPPDMFARLEPWAVALTLVQFELLSRGVDPAQGVEQQLQRRAAADRKPISGLETLEDQLGVLDGLSSEDQARFLELTIEDASDLDADLARILGAWRRADLEALESLLLEEYERFPSLYAPLVTGRNRAWMPAIERLLEREEDTLVVVGALHLVGPDGLLAMLERRGHTPRALGAGAGAQAPAGP